MGVFLKDDQTDAPAIAKTIEVGSYTVTAPTDTVGNSSTPLPVPSMPPRPRGIPPEIMLIYQAA